MHHYIHASHEFADQVLVKDGASPKYKAGVGGVMRDVIFVARGEIVENGDHVSPLHQGVHEVRADEACSAGDQVLHSGARRIDMLTYVPDVVHR
jgi:hypothetical protein